LRLAVLSDIHGNLEAFEAVLKDAHGLGIDAMASLGDNVGYGPDPEAVVRLLWAREIPSVAGNHELAVRNVRLRRWFNPTARRSVEMTRDALSPEAREYVAGLPNSKVLWGLRFVHGFPPRSPTLYLFQMSMRGYRRGLRMAPEPLIFVGHTHELDLVSWDGAALDFLGLKQGAVPLDPSLRYIVNAGSVGQPRDGDNRAKYVIWDDQTRILEVRFVAYDVDAVIRKIRAAGLPEVNATRLL
jgi:diadenosine tetraphosphatase ApaH/serine/threonine PP2A family protein phosphatase